MEVIFRNQYRRFTLLYDKAADEYYLNVFCGRVDLHNARVKLTPDQVSAYRNDGPAFLEDVAVRVREDETAKELYGVGTKAAAVDRKRQWWSLGR
jgi:hypothetical protein